MITAPLGLPVGLMGQQVGGCGRDRAGGLCEQRHVRQALGSPPGSAGQGTPELTEAPGAEGIPEEASRPSAVGGSAPERGVASRVPQPSASRQLSHMHLNEFTRLRRVHTTPTLDEGGILEDNTATVESPCIANTVYLHGLKALVG